MVEPKRKKVSFKANKIVKVPVKVTFNTRSGRRISFNATKAVRRSTKVDFYAKRKRK